MMHLANGGASGRCVLSKKVVRSMSASSRTNSMQNCCLVAQRDAQARTTHKQAHRMTSCIVSTWSWRSLDSTSASVHPSEEPPQ